MEDDDEDADDEDRIDTINLLIKFLLKLIKDVFIFSNNEFVDTYFQYKNWFLYFKTWPTFFTVTSIN
jgi:hypothetical protein